MKTGLSLESLAKELQRQKESMRDFVSSTTCLEMNSNGASKLNIEGQGEFKVTTHAHRQIGERLRVPAKHYDRLRENHPDLFDHVISELWRREPETRMIRTLDGSARAFLSDRYRRIDNYLVAEAALPVLGEFEGLDIKSCQVTEQKMYIKATYPILRREVKVGDVVEAGVEINNSETGQGRFVLFPFIYRLACLNGMRMNDKSLGKHHLGARIGSKDGDPYEFFRDETLQADDKALMLMMQDMIKAVLTEKVFMDLTDKLVDSVDQKIEGNPVKVVEVLSQRLDLNETEQGSVMQHLIQGHDLTRWGLANAVTSAANDVEDYTRSSDLQAYGGSVIELPDQDWRVIATAA